MVSPWHLIQCYTIQLLKRLELYLLLSGLLVFLTATRQTYHHSPADETTSVDSLISFAASFQGIPYRYGGKTPAGFDCSGFTRYVFQHFGMQLEASSFYQFRQGESIVPDSVQKGDLVFFKNSKNRINHVGIVTEKNTEQVLFIHASSSQGIKIDALQTAYYSKRLVGFKRIIPG